MRMPQDSPAAGGARTPSLAVSVVGEIAAIVNGGRLELRSKKSAALLGYLALCEASSETRERLAGLFWSESDEAKARGSLRQSLRSLRRSFNDIGFVGFYVDNHRVSIDCKLMQVDVQQVIDDVEQGGVHPKLLDQPRFCDRLFDGYDDVDPMFRVWVRARRQTVHDRLCRALEHRLADTQAPMRLRARTAAALVSLDATHESACRFLIRDRAENGDVGTALRIYKELWDRLDEEYGAEPSEETVQLIAKVKMGAFEPTSRADSNPTSAQPPAPAAPANAARQLTLGVAAFQVKNVSPAQSGVLTGFRHALIAALVRFREWHVVETTAAAPDEGEAPRFVIDASASPAADGLFLSMTLQDNAFRRFIWSDVQELRDGDWLALQQRVVGRVTAALNVYISVDRMNRISSAQKVAPELYELWLRGQALILRFRPEDWQRAQALLRNVIASAPEFAPAYSSLAQLGNTRQIVHPGDFRTAEHQSETLGLALRATQLDPIDSRAHLCLAWAYGYNEQYEQALAHFDLACDLNDHDPWTLLSAAQGYAFLGDLERAKVLSDRARRRSLQLGPSQWAYFAGIEFMRADYPQALEAARRAGDGLLNNGAWRAAALYGLGERAAAAREARACLDLIRSSWIGPDPPTDERIVAWVLQIFPIRHPADRERLRRSLLAAAAP